MIESMLITERNPQSGRWAAVADEGASVWLYLAERDGTEPVADCRLFNTVPPPTNLGEYRARESAPQ